MTSHLELFHAMREAIGIIVTPAIEQAVARTQIYLDRDAMIDASTSLQDLQLATSGLQAILDQCRNTAFAERLHTEAGRTVKCRSRREKRPVGHEERAPSVFHEAPSFLLALAYQSFDAHRRTTAEVVPLPIRQIDALDCAVSTL